MMTTSPGDPVHRHIDDEWGHQAIAPEASDQSLRFPVAEGRFGVESLALEAATAQACHLRGRASFVDKDQPIAFPAHDWLTAFLPVASRLGNVRSVLFGCPECFF